MAYHAALSLLDAKVLFSGLKVSALLDPTTDSSRNALERHHLFPKAWLKRNGFTEVNQINQIANYALIEYPDNANISDQSPSLYWPNFKARYSEEDWRVANYWHGLPDGWSNMAYVDFLAERRKRIAQVIRDGFEKI